MTITALDDYETEDYEAEAEDYDSEGEYDGEDARSDAARRRRARRILLDRQRMGQRRRLPQPVTRPGPPTARATVAAIRNLDLKTKVGEDELRRSMDQANRRARMAGYVTATSVAVDQALDTFSDDLDGHDLIRSLIRVAPLLLLSPQRTRPGVEGYLLDPRVLGGAAVAGIAAVGAFRNRGTGVDHIEINAQASPTVGDKGRFLAVAVDGKGRDVDTTIKWASTDTNLIRVFDNGDFEALAPGIARVTAEAKDVRQSFFVTIAAKGNNYQAQAATDGTDAAGGRGGGRRSAASGTS
ncbi:hypothetical protein ACIA5D_28225 [Actinoplanes sp. NPDC051513]|uniref:hypothetical protein n=1 Tax=Actinoplanes sp. NPDC051513 TaxID=3363908 RepID=UPI00378FA31C